MYGRGPCRENFFLFWGVERFIYGIMSSFTMYSLPSVGVLEVLMVSFVAPLAPLALKVRADSLEKNRLTRKNMIGMTEDDFVLV